MFVIQYITDKEEHFLWVVRDERPRVKEALLDVTAAAVNPELDFNWYDAACVCKAMQNESKALQEAMNGH